MNIQKYAEEIQRTCATLRNKEEDTIHMILGMVTEVGELADTFKKNMAYNKEIDWVNVEEEVGDITWYLVNFCSKNNIDIERCFDKNVAKLRARYPEKFSEEMATNRDLKKERETLEKL